MSKNYKYPQSLVDFITAQESEGSEIHTSKGSDDTIWIIKPSGLNNKSDGDNWYILVSWLEGQDKYSIVNLTGAALRRLKFCLAEDDPMISFLP